MLLPTVFLAFLSAGRVSSAATPPRLHIVSPLAAERTSTEHLIFDAKRSIAFVQELKSFLSLLPDLSGGGKPAADSYGQSFQTFSDAASNEGVAGAQSGNPVELAYDWIDQGEWKYFVRLEVDFAAFDALFNGAKQDSLYRDITAACLIYGGQGILDFKHNVPDYIDSLHQEEEFKTSKFEPRNKKQVRWAYRLAGQQVDLQLARYRLALAYLRSRGIDSDALRKKAEEEQSTELRAILLHYADLLGWMGRGPREQRASTPHDHSLVRRGNGTRRRLLWLSCGSARKTNRSFSTTKLRPLKRIPGLPLSCQKGRTIRSHVKDGGWFPAFLELRDGFSGRSVKC